jgi:hypothetical protein
LTQNPQNPPIKVKMKIGDIEFEIEAQPDQIQTAVDRILSTSHRPLKNTNLAKVAERPAPLPRAETCKGVIQKLWEENWFSEPRGLDDVHTELARKGFHYDRTAVAHALVDLVKDNILTRIGKPRRYQYAQKRPIFAQPLITATNKTPLNLVLSYLPDCSRSSFQDIPI